MSELRVAVVGAGWGGELHLVGFSGCQNASVVALSSRTESTARALADRYGVPSVYTNLAEMLDKERPDVVSIATPPDVHREMAFAALERGCHVLCDKPVALTGAESEELYRAAEAKGVRHATGFIWRNDPAILRLRELIADGTIGELREIHSRSALGAPVLPMTWVYDKEAGGGALMQHGGHVIDRARWLLGREFTAVNGDLIHDVKEAVVGPRFHNVMDAFAWAGKRAMAREADDLPTTPVTADTGYGFQAQFEGGVRGLIWESMHSHGLVPEQVDVFGSTGTLVWSGAGGLSLVRPRTAPQPIAVEGSSEAGSGDMIALRDIAHGLWVRMCQAYVDAILGREHESYPNLYDGWKVQQVIDAVNLSDSSGKWESAS